MSDKEPFTAPSSFNENKTLFTKTVPMGPASYLE